MLNIVGKISDIEIKVALEDPSSDHELFEQLTYAQQFATTSLKNFGYSLVHAVLINNSVVAILKAKDKYAIVKANGEIEMNHRIN